MTITALILFCYFPFSSPAFHSLQYFYMFASGIPEFPEFIMNGMVDNITTFHYDSNTTRVKPKTWMNDYNNSDYWDNETTRTVAAEQTFRISMDTAKEKYNQIEAIPLTGVHVLQYMYGCQWDNESGATDGYEQYGYDGEDLLTLGVQKRRWFSEKSWATITKNKWNRARPQLHTDILYIRNICIVSLKEYVEHGRDALGRRVPPEVSVLQKNSSAVCHATGFYPEAANITWKRDGEEMQEDVNVGETLANEDGTFQKRAVLTISPEERKKSKYTCEVAHESGLMVKTLSEEDGNILYVGIIICCIGAVVIVTVVVMMKKKKNTTELKDIYEGGRRKKEYDTRDLFLHEEGGRRKKEYDTTGRMEDSDSNVDVGLDRTLDEGFESYQSSYLSDNVG